MTTSSKEDLAMLAKVCPELAKIKVRPLHLSEYILKPLEYERVAARMVEMMKLLRRIQVNRNEYRVCDCDECKEIARLIGGD